MARIRSIKPEFWTSEQVAECSPNARLLFIGMWNFCDDQGIHPASVKTLKMQIFPGDSFSLSDIENMVIELMHQKLLFFYQANDKGYWYVTGWNHQKIDKPNNKYPKPDAENLRVFLSDHSPTGSRPLADHLPEEGKGREGRGNKESKLAEKFSEKRVWLAGRFPDVDLDFQLEKLLAKYEGKSVIDPWQLILAWFEAIPKRPPGKPAKSVDDDVFKGCR
jgi:hypothetical protein